MGSSNSQNQSGIQAPKTRLKTALDTDGLRSLRCSQDMGRCCGDRNPICHPMVGKERLEGEGEIDFVARPHFWSILVVKMTL